MEHLHVYAANDRCAVVIPFSHGQRCGHVAGTPDAWAVTYTFGTGTSRTVTVDSATRDYLYRLFR